VLEHLVIVKSLLLLGKTKCSLCSSSSSLCLVAYLQFAKMLCVFGCDRSQFNGPRIAQLHPKLTHLHVHIILLPGRPSLPRNAAKEATTALRWHFHFDFDLFVSKIALKFHKRKGKNRNTMFLIVKRREASQTLR